LDDDDGEGQGMIGPSNDSWTLNLVMSSDPKGRL
jgi:hypothetical protein